VTLDVVPIFPPPVCGEADLLKETMGHAELEKVGTKLARGVG
jgi:hypothetical protein